MCFMWYPQDYSFCYPLLTTRLHSPVWCLNPPLPSSPHHQHMLSHTMMVSQWLDSQRRVAFPEHKQKLLCPLNTNSQTSPAGLPPAAVLPFCYPAYSVFSKCLGTLASYTAVVIFPLPSFLPSFLVYYLFGG